MKKYLRLLFAVICCCPAICLAQIGVSQSDTYLISKKDGKPFFWLADTGWELFHRLTREEANHYLKVRKKQGFNVIMSVALAEMDGIRKPNRYGDVPFENIETLEWALTPGNNPANSDEYDYWDHVDFVIQEAAKHKMYIGLLPTWGDKVNPGASGPVVFKDEITAYNFAKKLTERYKNQWNIIWILGGDRCPVQYKDNNINNEVVIDYRPIWRAMAKAIRETFGKDVFIAYHPSWPPTSFYFGNDDWLSINALQSGHGSREVEAWKIIADELKTKPLRPVIDLEPCYEDHPVNVWDGKWTRKERGYFNDYDVRARIYRGVFAGGCGAVYGHHQIWQFLDTLQNPPVWIGDTIIGWQKALSSKAAGHIHHLKDLMLSRPDFDRIQDYSIVTSSQGTGYTDAVIATRNRLGTYAMIYLPQLTEIEIDLDKLKSGEKRISWFNPVTGKYTKLKNTPSSGRNKFTPPNNAQKDWVLVVDVL